MTYNYEEIGKRIRKARTEAGYSLERVAEACNVQQYQTVSNWEKGKTFPSLDVLLRMCDLYDCQLGYLLGEYNCRTREKTDIQEETGLSEKAIDNLMVAVSAAETGGIDNVYANALHDNLRNQEIGRFAKIHFLQVLLENDDVWERLSVCAYDYRRQIRMNEINSFHTVEGITHLQFANVSKNEAKEIISDLFKKIDWDVYSDEWEAK